MILDLIIVEERIDKSRLAGFVVEVVAHRNALQHAS